MEVEKIDQGFFHAGKIGIELRILHGGKVGNLSEGFKADQDVCAGLREEGVDIGKIRPAARINTVLPDEAAAPSSLSAH